MSWSVNVAAKSREAAIKHVEDAQKVGAAYFPKEAAEGVIALIESVGPLGQGKGLEVSAHGHPDPSYGTAKAEIRVVDLVG